MQVFANNAYSSLGASLSNSATSLTLATATGIRFPSPTGGSYFLLTLVGLDSNGNENAWEIVKVTGRASDALTIVRAQESTTAVAWAAGTRVELRATAGTFSSYATLAAPTFTGGITVSSGGASITGDTSVTGTLSASGITNTQTESVVALTSTAGSARNWQLVSGGGTLGAAGNFYLRNATSGAAPVIVDGAAANGTVYVGSTGLAVSGNIISGLTTRTVYNYSGWLGALSNGLRLRTPLGYASNNFYQLTIRGYHYRNGGSADLTICWYGFSSFGYPINTSVTTSGGWNPTIWLGNNAGTTDIYFALDDSDGYYLFFDVDVTSLAAVPSSGWAVADVAYSSGGVLVPYVQKLGRAAAVTGTGGDSRLAVGQGITFPATQNPSSDANTLDDYEEGTWTPSVNLLGTLTYGTQYGKYVKIGRQVTVNFSISVSSTDTTQDSSTFLISGFPFTAADGATAKVLTERAYYMSGDSTKSRTFNVYLGASSSTASVQVEQWNGAFPNASYYTGAIRTIYQAGGLIFSGTIVYFV